MNSALPWQWDSPRQSRCLSWLRMLHCKWHGMVRVRSGVCYRQILSKWADPVRWSKRVKCTCTEDLLDRSTYTTSKGVTRLNVSPSASTQNVSIFCYSKYPWNDQKQWHFQASPSQEFNICLPSVYQIPWTIINIISRLIIWPQLSRAITLQRELLRKTDLRSTNQSGENEWLIYDTR